MQPKTIVIRDAGQMSVYWEHSASIEVSGFPTIRMAISFVKGDSDGCLIRNSFSLDGEKWYHSNEHRRLDESMSTRIDIPVAGLFMIVYYRAIGQSTNTSLSVLAVLEKLKG